MSNSTVEAGLSTAFRDMMSGFPTGVSVVTTFGEYGAPHGMTCSSLCSVTLEPPTLLVCLRALSPTLHAILAAGSFAVNLLHHEGLQVARLFASGARDRFDQIDWEAGPVAAGPHLVRHSHAIADCTVSGTRPVGDHVVLFGEARRIVLQENAPLLHGLREFRSWSAP